jgi:hypothetical protein
MNKLIEMFPDESRKRRKKYGAVGNTPDDPAFTNAVGRGMLIAIGGVAAFFLILILIGFINWLTHQPEQAWLR